MPYKIQEAILHTNFEKTPSLDVTKTSFDEIK